jgi:hypothetical protein
MSKWLPKYHHFTPERLLALEWDPAINLRIERSDGWVSEMDGYHEATFPIGADEVGRIFIPDTALELLEESENT